MPNDATHPGLVSRGNAEHYRWGGDCDGWRLVNDENLSIIEERMPSGSSEVRHYHKKAQQFFFVLSGEVMMEVEGHNTLVCAGSGIRVFPGARHQISNLSSAEVRFLVISQPPSQGDRFSE
ncbi:MAG: cupin domain-containing protein [Candidatus Sulfotelmatobacter sp.]|jgi:mannose-6-phosphate isomerase-like protein (cupin superfamily)